MTEDNLRTNVAFEVANAGRLLKAAAALLGIDCFPDAANRAYYAVFHLTIAMLLVVGHEPRTHAGAKGLLGSELVRVGRIDAKAARIFAVLEDLRVASDYRRLVEVSRIEAERALEDATEFQRMARAFLAAQGF